MARRRRDRDTPEADAVLHQPLAQLLSPAPMPARALVTYQPTNLLDVEDRRSYHPQNIFRAPKQFSGHPVKPHVIKNQPKFKNQLPFGLKFAVPENTVICVRRKQRREVIFAKNKSGGGSRRKPRKNWNSKIGC